MSLTEVGRTVATYRSSQGIAVVIRPVEAGEVRSEAGRDAGTAATAILVGAVGRKESAKEREGKILGRRAVG